MWDHHLRLKFSLCLWFSSVPLAAVRSMDVYDEAVTTMRVRWPPVTGAQGYMLVYRSVNASEPQQEKEVKIKVKRDQRDLQPFVSLDHTDHFSSCSCESQETNRTSS